MQQPWGIENSDLEPRQSDFEQELTAEETEKVVGGINENPFDFIDIDDLAMTGDNASTINLPDMNWPRKPKKP